MLCDMGDSRYTKWRRRTAWATACATLVLAGLWLSSAAFVYDAGVVVATHRVRARCAGGAYIVEVETWTPADVLATGSVTRWAEVRRPWSGAGGGSASWTWGLDASWHHVGVRAEILGAPFSPQQPDSLAVAGGWPVLIAGSVVLWLWHGDRRSRRRALAGACPSCGYDLAGLTPGSTCPECGADRPGLARYTPP